MEIVKWPKSGPNDLGLLYILYDFIKKYLFEVVHFRSSAFDRVSRSIYRHFFLENITSLCLDCRYMLRETQKPSAGHVSRRSRLRQLCAVSQSELDVNELQGGQHLTGNRCRTPVDDNDVVFLIANTVSDVYM
jgi:hypothetical protein